MPSFHNPESHLQRAKSLLADGKPESLFYAALEFRYSVEGRLLEYAEHADKFTKRRSGVWKVRDIAKHVDSVFKINDNIYSIEMQSPKMPNSVTIEYTPITDKVRSLVGRTDNFLHHSGVTQCDSKFSQLRELLEEGIAEMEGCLAGGLQGTPVTDSTGTIHMKIDLGKYPELEQSIVAGDRLDIRVDIRPYPGESGT
jgi:hypothetical protein